MRLRLQVQRVTTGWEARFGARRAPGAIPRGGGLRALGGGNLYDLVSRLTNPELMSMSRLSNPTQLVRRCSV